MIYSHLRSQSLFPSTRGMPYAPCPCLQEVRKSRLIGLSLGLDQAPDVIPEEDLKRRDMLGFDVFI